MGRLFSFLQHIGGASALGRLVLGIAVGAGLAACASTPNRQVVVSVRDQKVALMEAGHPVRVYPCSTSKFCVSDRPGSYGTPVGKLQIAQKIGQGAPLGAVFHSRQRTGEVLRPNAPGRDPIVTRIMWLRGLQSQNAQAYARHIYIHGTPEERLIGRPASFGCVRMRSLDVADLFDRVPVGTEVSITKSGLPGKARSLAREQEAAPEVFTPPPPNYGSARSGHLVHNGTFGPGVR